jgi:CubicO group peptidase (beta-lactamase class C family)
MLASAFSALADAQTEPCAQALVQQIAVKGLDPADLTYPVSSITIPTLGFASKDMSSVIDPLVANYMNQNGPAGGTVAITYNNHLIFAKSYGYADIANGLFMQPDSVLRIASLTKSFTAMGILKMVHDNSLFVVGGQDWQLNVQPFTSPGFGAPIGGSRQTWIEAATVRDLLYHEGGWGEDYEGYSTLSAVETVLGTSSPPDCQTLLRYVQSQPMTPVDFTPGNGQAYSNIGFCALGETIRQLSGSASYFDYMKSNVLAPLGLNDTQIGSSEQSKQLDREVVYYPCGYISGTAVPLTAQTCGYGNPAPSVVGRSLFPPHGTVSAAYGGGTNTFSLTASEGAGGFVSTAIDLARFTGAISSGQLPNFPGGVLHPGWPQNFYSLTTAETPYEKTLGQSTYFGMGWDTVQPNPVGTPFLSYNNFNLEKNGGLPGTVSGMATTGDGYSFAAVFNGDNGNSTPSPVDSLFWPAGAALQTAYTHANAEAWNFDFFPEFAQEYTSWMSPSAFATHLAAQESSGYYPSRLEGRAVINSRGTGSQTIEYRARFSSQPLAAGTPAPRVLYGQSCAAVLSAVESAPASTPLVSLQSFYDLLSRSTYYQAVWSAPIPQLPASAGQQ